MHDHHRRVKNAVRLAKDIYTKKLLQDIYPTSYLPHVGRQVMKDGGPPEDVSEDAQYDAMGNVVVPSSRKASSEDRYRQPFGERVSEGISKGFGEHRLGMSEENQMRYDPTGILQTFAAPADLALRAPGAIVGGLSAAGAGLYGMLPGTSESDVNRLQRDLRVLGDVGMVEAGQVRPKAPTSTDMMPRGGDILAPETVAKPMLEGRKPSTIDVAKSPEPTVAFPGTPKTMLEAPKVTPEPVVEPKIVTEAAPAAPPAPSYARQTSDMGLYSHAAEIAAKAKQAGKPEDLINWLKRQPGVRLEELRDAGAVNRDGSYNPNFAPNIKKMTPQDLADRLHGSIPEVVDYIRPEFETVKVSDPVDLINTAERNPSVWNTVFSDVYGDWLSHHPESLRQMLEEPMAQSIAERYFNENNGVVKTKGEAKYSPSSYSDLTTTGGDNYREIALSLTPYEENPKMYFQIQGPMGKDTLYETGEQASQALEEIKSKAAEIFKDDPSQLDIINRNIARSRVTAVDDPSFKSRNVMNYGHMTDIPNNLAWLRVQDVPHPSGQGKALRVEETQSDISQQGRGRGFRMNESELAEAQKSLDASKEDFAKRSEAIKAKFNDFVAGDTRGYSDKWDAFLSDPVNRAEYNDLRKAEKDMADRKKAISKNDDLLPRLPYMEDTKQWTDLTVKRALVEAVKGGYDSLQFIKGDINRERYPGYEEGDAGYHYDVNIPSSLKRVLKSIDPDAKIETVTQRANENDPRYVALKGYYERDIRLSEEAMNDVRRNIHEEPLEENRRDLEYELQDLQGELDDLYARLNVLTTPKKFWSVEMTPKIREAVSKGLPRYKDGGKVSSYPLRNHVDWEEAHDYEKTGGKMHWDTPEHYLHQVKPLNMDHDDKKIIHHFKKQMKKGEKLDPVAIYPDNHPNGRHRAHAAKKLGVKKIPVVTWPKKSEGGAILQMSAEDLQKLLEG